ncbi:MAG: hypothetical protein FI737_11085 [SAR202 cluster bacterium]|nr:hypothetical protein [SAR202 cluster bacterium]
MATAKPRYPGAPMSTSASLSALSRYWPGCTAEIHGHNRQRKRPLHQAGRRCAGPGPYRVGPDGMGNVPSRPARRYRSRHRPHPRSNPSEERYGEDRSRQWRPTIESDTDKLVQATTNLLSNSIKFTPSGGLIHVQCRLPPSSSQANRVNMVEVSVSDNGLGIPVTEHGRIFDRFQQAESSLSDGPAGAGLGLAISKEIAVHRGGKTWVESEPDEGSTFFFTVPVADAIN